MKITIEVEQEPKHKPVEKSQTATISELQNQAVIGVIVEPGYISLRFNNDWTYVFRSTEDAWLDQSKRRLHEARY